MAPNIRPRPRTHTNDELVRIAVMVADHDGAAGLSLRTVAAAAQMGTMTIYTYFPSRAALVAAMADHVLGEWRIHAGDTHSAAVHFVRHYARSLELHPWLLDLAPGAAARRWEYDPPASDLAHGSVWPLRLHALAGMVEALVRKGETTDTILSVMDWALDEARWRA